MTGYLVSDPKVITWTQQTTGQELSGVVFVFRCSDHRHKQLYDVWIPSKLMRYTLKTLKKKSKILIVTFNEIEFKFNKKIQEWRPVIRPSIIETFPQGHEDPPMEFLGAMEDWLDKQKDHKKSQENYFISSFNKQKKNT